MNENNENSVQGTETAEAGSEEKMYSQAELDAEVQRIADQRVSQALKTAEKKNQAKLKEAEKLAAMNEQQKLEYQLQQRELAIAEKEKELALAENKAEATKILAEKGLNPQLVDFVVAESADDMASNIDLLERAFKLSVKAEVEKRLASNSPKKSLPLDKSITKEDFMKMSYAEMVQLKTQNPELYRELQG